MIEFKRVNKYYGAHHVLRDVTMTVSRGEVVVVCGPSGSGKSTLIKCVNALEPYQGGHIIVDGIDVGSKARSATQLRQRVGMVFQHFDLFSHLTAIENITWRRSSVLNSSARLASERRARRLLGVVGLRTRSGLSDEPIRGPAAAHRDRACARARSEDHAVRRADLGARSRNDQRSSEGYDSTSRATA